MTAADAGTVLTLGGSFDYEAFPHGFVGASVSGGNVENIDLVGASLRYGFLGEGEHLTPVLYGDVGISSWSARDESALMMDLALYAGIRIEAFSTGGTAVLVSSEMGPNLFRPLSTPLPGGPRNGVAARVQISFRFGE